jgi:hypothetical protein
MRKIAIAVARKRGNLPRYHGDTERRRLATAYSRVCTSRTPSAVRSSSNLPGSYLTSELGPIAPSYRPLSSSHLHTPNHRSCENRARTDPLPDREVAGLRGIPPFGREVREGGSVSATHRRPKKFPAAYSSCKAKAQTARIAMAFANSIISLATARDCNESGLAARWLSVPTPNCHQNCEFMPMS